MTTTPNPAPVTTSDAEREAFEATVGAGRVLTRTPSGDYVSPYVQNDWDVWQVAGKEIQRSACNFCLSEAAKARAALPIDFKQATDQGGWQHVPEGCTPADARMLRAANHGLAAENDQLREALQFYADGSHFIMHDANAWDTVSGEPANFYEDEANTATVEDGSVAKMALVLQSEAAPTLQGVADGDAA